MKRQMYFLLRTCLYTQWEREDKKSSKLKEVVSFFFVVIFHYIVSKCRSLMKKKKVILFHMRQGENKTHKYSSTKILTF